MTVLPALPTPNPATRGERAKYIDFAKIKKGEFRNFRLLSQSKQGYVGRSGTAY
jgi:hypothetical protein